MNLEKRILPTFQCYSCGNCETDFHTDEKIKDETGFCLKFKENTPLTQKNIRCWTHKKSEHYSDFFLETEKKRRANNHKEKKIAQQFNLFFDDSNNPFQDV